MRGAQPSCRLLAGQGATEYLVLLAVVLIIALVGISLLGFAPGTADEAKITQSKAYWQSATPLAIVDGAGVEKGTAPGAIQMLLPGGSGESNYAIITLRNTGSASVELVAINRFQTGHDLESNNLDVPFPSGGRAYRKNWIYLNPGANGGDQYGLYLSLIHI